MEVSVARLIQQTTNWWCFFFYYYFIFPQKTGWDISCKLSLIETMSVVSNRDYVKSCFLKTIRKNNISMSSAENFTQMLSVSNWSTLLTTSFENEVLCAYVRYHAMNHPPANICKVIHVFSCPLIKNMLQRIWQINFVVILDCHSCLVELTFVHHLSASKLVIHKQTHVLRTHRPHNNCAIALRNCFLSKNGRRKTPIF